LASLTIENYIKTIYQICVSADGAPAATGKLASALDVSPGTVTSMIKSLNTANLVAYTPYEGVQLTDEGRSLALRVLRRHRLIELFLVQTLNLSWDEVHEEAEHMEHAVSDLLVDRIDAFLGHPNRDPHGDPIPRADGSIPTGNTSALLDWPVGAKFCLTRVLDQSPDFLRFLSDSGLRLQTTGVVLSRNEAAGTATVSVDDRRITMALDAARKMMVSPLSEEEATVDRP